MNFKTTILKIIVSALLILLMAAGQGMALVDTNISFLDPNSINDIDISGLNGSVCTINITNNSVYLYDSSATTPVPKFSISTSEPIINYTVDFDILPIQNDQMFFIYVSGSGNQIYFRFNPSGRVEYINTSEAYTDIAPYTANVIQHMFFSRIGGNVSVTFNGVQRNITTYQYSPNIKYLWFESDSYYQPKFYISNVTIVNLDLPTLPSTLRKYPYPYKAAWTLSSDIDSDNQTELFTQMDYFNTRETIYEKNSLVGIGLGLDISQNFWMNNNRSIEPAYYKNYSEIPTDFAPYQIEYMKSGHMDTLHKWAESSMDQSKRDWLKSVITMLKLNGIYVTVWINHGSYTTSFDGIGTTFNNTLGDDSDNATWYHTNETMGNYSVRYYTDGTYFNSYLMIVMRVLLAVIGMSRCRCGRCHFQILPCSPFRTLRSRRPCPVDVRVSFLAYCAAAPAEANEFAGAAANFFFALSTQAANS